MNGTVIIIDGYQFDTPDTHRVSTGSLAAPIAQVTDGNTEAYTLKPTWNKVPGADFYEIEFNGMLYTQIKNAELLFDNLSAENRLFVQNSLSQQGRLFRLSTFSVKTKSNPLEFAIKGIRGEVTPKKQEGFEISRLFDYAELGDMFHTKYRKNAMPFDMIIDLRTINQLDKFHYLSRQDGATERSLPATWPTAWIRKTGQRSTRSAGNVMVT